MVAGGPKLLLNDGNNIPALGFGTWQCTGDAAITAVLAAIDIGYRHIDTAWIYNNEREVGQAVRDSGLSRDEVYITSKLWIDDMGYEESFTACRKSLDLMGVDYLDLYLIHWPVIGKWQAAWDGLLKLREEGLCRSIGVSNFRPRLLDEIVEKTGVVPAVNQVEFSPFGFDKELLSKCVELGIKLECYSPLTHGHKLTHSTLIDVGGRYGKTPAQVLIKWGLQHDLVSLPKASSPGRIAENYNVFDFELGEADMALLDSLDEGFQSISAEWTGKFDGYK